LTSDLIRFRWNVPDSSKSSTICRRRCATASRTSTFQRSVASVESRLPD
jgi:hypothetical protein